MSLSLEFEGKNVDKAVEIACKELNLSKDELKYDVVSYGSSGIFGLVGVKKARIKVFIPDTSSNTYADDATMNNYQQDELDSEIESNSLLDDETEDSDASDTTEDINLENIPDETLQIGKEILQQIVGLITEEATITIQKQPDRIMFLVTGGNSAALIGRHGQTLEAIQYLIDKIVNKRTERRIRIQVDIEKYIENRINNLRSMALRLAEKAKKTGKPVTVGQLNAHDRRIVHIALKDDNSVRTQSTGEGQHRRLVVYPKKSSKKHK